MSWAKLDDRYDDNRKIKRAWRKDRASVAIHAMAVTYCSRHRTDGVVDIDWLEEKLTTTKERARTIAVLVEVGLFEPLDEGEHWYVHDYLEYNPSRQDKEEASDAARNAALVRWSKAQDAKRNAEPHADRNAKGIAVRIADRNAESMRDPMPLPTPPVPSSKASSGGPDVGAVFDEWIKVTGRTGATLLTEKRRRLIAAALKLYALADVIDAVRGWQFSAHHRGENDSGTVYNDIELLLRDPQHIERFRDLARQRSNGRGNAPPTLAAIHAAQEARR